MSLLAKVQQARELVFTQGRISLRLLGRELDLDEDLLEEIVSELVEVLGVARLDGRILVATQAPATQPVEPTRHSAPVPRPAYTPKHLADRILSTRAAMEDERKQVTVLFADVKGSMEIARAQLERGKRGRGMPAYLGNHPATGCPRRPCT